MNHVLVCLVDDHVLFWDIKNSYRAGTYVLYIYNVHQPNAARFADLLVQCSWDVLAPSGACHHKC